jgi:Domain of unknown function (DUF6438)
MNEFARAAILLLAACACRSTAPVGGPPRTISAPATLVPNDFVLSLQRGECFGDCPIYTVTVDAAGNVEYEGTKFVTVTGAARWSVSTEVVAHLFKLLERVHFLDLEFECHRYISDVPTQTISLDVGGRERVLANRWGGGSEFLFLLGEGGKIDPEEKLDPDLHVHALLGWLASWIDYALDTAPYVHGDKPRGSE